ncbi:MAG: patatin [Gammaproteobacteria bacterium]|nr:MAG: patatin [Gammaproteobacteria bacterium]
MVFRSKQARLERDLKNAESYDAWLEAARALDEYKGNMRWRKTDHSHQYDHVALRLRLDRLRELHARHDYRGLLFTLGEGIHGNLGGMGKPGLYQRALSGTKQLIEDYVDEVIETLDLLASDRVTNISFEEKRDFFRRAHHCFGCSALMMSGSGTLLFFHFGVVKAMAEQGLLPSILSGSSGGGIVASLVCTHTDEELARFFDAGHLADEVEEEVQAMQAARVGRSPLLTQPEVESLIARLVPDMTFKEAYEHTGRMLNISIAPAEAHQTSRLLNATTSPNVLIRRAALASAAVPGVFPPVMLEARDTHGERQPYLPSRKWVDGSVSEDLPAKRLARLYGVNHYIVSQANPHILPFVSDREHSRGALNVVTRASRATLREWANAALTLSKRPLRGYPALQKMGNTFLSVINQSYVGDINIIPRQRFHNPTKILAHPQYKDVIRLVQAGERAAWPKLEMVRIQTRIGSRLVEILEELDHDYVRQHELAAREKVA